MFVCVFGAYEYPNIESCNFVQKTTFLSLLFLPYEFITKP